MTIIDADRETPVTSGTWYRFRRDATLQTGPDGERRLTCPTSEMRLGRPGASSTLLLDRLAAGEVADGALDAVVGESAMVTARMLLTRLGAAGLLERGIRRDRYDLAVLRPVGRGPLPRRPRTGPGVRRRLSRFTTVRAQAGALVAEAPDSPLVVELSTALAPLLGALAESRDRDALAAVLAGERPDLGADLDAVLALLDEAGLLTADDEAGDEAGDESTRASWSVPDLWLHARSRGPGLGAGYGGTYPGGADAGVLPLAPPERGTERVPLPAPDLAAVTAQDLTLTDALERRRSVRAHDTDRPITRAQLGELLYRCLRTRDRFEVEGDELGSRPYPAGGSLHELEVYAVVTACEGLSAGVWHYRGTDHELEWVPSDEPSVAGLVETARASCLMKTPPQVVLVVTARFGRVMRKYEGMAYALVLKHVGVLFQTLYLVATSMGLAPCALGGGDAFGFARATGTDWTVEGSVGEFVLGSAVAEH